MTRTTALDAPPESLRLARDAYWEPPLGLCQRVADALLVEPVGATRSFLSAPDVVDLEQRSTLPVLAALRGEAGSSLGPEAFARRAVVHAIDPETGHGAVALLSALDGPVHETAVPDRFARVIRTDLRERLRLGWRTGELLLTVLSFEHASNRVRVRLAFPPHRVGGDFDAYLASERPLLGSAGSPLVPLSKSERAPIPPLPASGGVALRVDALHRHAEGVPLLVHGAFDVPFERSAPPSGVPIRIVVLSSVLPQPQEGIVWVPPSGNSDNGRARGAFAVDLGAMLPPPPSSTPERLYLHAFAGPAASAPAVTTRFDDALVASPLA
jgi:hypothetical protein